MKLVFIHEEPRIIPGIGLFKPGDKVEFSDELFNTGLFKKETKQKEGEK
jgi:hypothetical protein